MISRKRISLALAALVLVVLAGAGSAFAQTVNFDLRTTPTEVANTGRSEVLGQVTLTATAICGTNADGICLSTAGTLQITYDRTAIDNSSTTGIEICETVVGVTTCNLPGTYLTTGVVTIDNTNSAAVGGVINFSVKGGVDFTAGDVVVIRGVRGRIDLSVAGAEIRAFLTASPSTIASAVPSSEVVARPKPPLVITTDPGTLLQCLPGTGEAHVIVTEGFTTAFVDHGDASESSFPGAPANPRPLFGGTNNSRVNIVLTNKPSGITINWPATSAAAASGAVLDLVSQSASGDTALYVFSTSDQGVSDVTSESFDIEVDAADVDLGGTPADFGTATLQGQMNPPVTPTGVRPRYNDPLHPTPGLAFLTVAPCTTNLLFNWVLNFAGLDTGIAISNTSADPYDTDPQSGTCTLNLFPTDKTTNNGVSAGGAISITTGTVEAGSVWRGTMSGTPAFAGQAGYIIAVCRFQYGHGFAFITDNFGVGPAATAQGYLAQVIPDPVILGHRAASNAALDVALPAFFPPFGEGLGQ